MWTEYLELSNRTNGFITFPTEDMNNIKRNNCVSHGKTVSLQDSEYNVKK
jgi:hypothetical protein